MRVLCDEERIPQQGAMLLGTLEQAAALCLKEEGIPDERVEISLSFVSIPPTSSTPVIESKHFKQTSS